MVTMRRDVYQNKYKKVVWCGAGWESHRVLCSDVQLCVRDDEPSPRRTEDQEKRWNCATLLQIVKLLQIDHLYTQLLEQIVGLIKPVHNVHHAQYFPNNFAYFCSKSVL